MDVRTLLEVMVKQEASDLYLTVDAPPVYRIHGSTHRTDAPPFSNEQLESLALAMMRGPQRGEFEEKMEMNLALYYKDLGRFRVNVFRQQSRLFLVLFLFYCAYFMLRFSLEDGPRRARSSAVYALFGIVLVPVSFLAIRLAEDFIHPTVFTREGPQMTGTMFAAFCVSWAAVTFLAYVLYRVELAGKRLDADLRELREALAS